MEQCDTPLCPDCKSDMKVVCIGLTSAGYMRRRFECATCTNGLDWISPSDDTNGTASTVGKLILN